ncbi:MAG: hypothetical protein DI535_02385 [Citrobacter freundii]|nr:MAG: hypothetical protein DI535_02385 [Citrobacter freundii]
MRKRVHKVANFLAFNLLFFALYLNFIYKDPAVSMPAVKTQQEPAAFSGELTDSKAIQNPNQPESPVKTTAILPAKTTH